METTASLQDIALQEQETGKKARLDYIDVAKGILILAVVLAHAWFANINILGHMVPFSMPAFFFLSGYTYKPGRGYFKNLGKRVVGLLLPYVFFSTACTLLYPVYVNLAKTPVWQQTGMGPIWTAVAKADALNMLMATPMWFLVALFTGSILFFAIADRTRGSLKWTVLSAAVLVTAALVIDVLKKNTLWWFVDLAPYTAAMMVIGAYCGNKKVFSKITLRAVLIGLVCLAVAEIVNIYFPGSNKTSVVTYIEPKTWYGVLTAFVIAVTGTFGTLLVARLVEKIPVVRRIFIWLGQNSIWILCIHYCAIMLMELYLYNHKVLSNSIMDVVAVELFGFGKVTDKPKDVAVKVAVALVSIGLSAIYALIHKSVKKAIKSRKAA
ncbi:MAG: acyltransferase family protein [Oscillospiraceae bacterium]|nr:acyltransferase family protein [Oscillospiraceae bacterium]